MIKESKALLESLSQIINQSMSHTFSYPKGCFGIQVTPTFVHNNSSFSLNFNKSKEHNNAKCTYPKEWIIKKYAETFDRVQAKWDWRRLKHSILSTPDSIP